MGSLKESNTKQRMVKNMRLMLLLQLFVMVASQISAALFVNQRFLLNFCLHSILFFIYYFAKNRDKLSLILMFAQVEVPSCFVGLILENCQLPFANHGHVVLADPSPILFYPISSTEVRCLVDVPGQKVPSIANGAMANYLKNTVAPQVSVLFSMVILFFDWLHSF